jgi:Ceramidase
MANTERAASCMPDGCFCEAIATTGFKQPANTWSSLAFVVVAVLVLLRWAKDWRVSGQPMSPVLFSFTLLVIGTGSAFFHATLSFRGQFVDVLGMYLIATFALLYGIDRLGNIGNRGFVFAYLASNTVLAAVLYWAPVLRRIVFGLLIAAVLGVEILISRRTGARRGLKKLQVAVVLLGTAFAIWILDYTRVACRPESWIQGHAAWHVLGAFAVWYLYLYYREQSE